MNLTPKSLIESINAISDEYFELCTEMANIAERSGVAWLEIRQTCKTNAEADQAWRTTPDGRREQYLKWYLKGLEKKRAALVMEYKSNQGTGW